jgi:hypothetical protein
VVRKVGILAVAAVLGLGSALGVAACGEDREGEVEFEGGTGTTVGTGTVGTETVGTEAAETEAPETEAETGEAETETTP